MKRRLTVALLLLIGLIGGAFAENGDVRWFRSAKFGVFVHFLGGGENWNDRVNAFDAKAFADRVKETGAGYVIFTLGQNSGYYCSPNAAYEKYAGYQTGERCSKRDLPMELADALGKHGIRLMLYLPSRSPQRDEQAMKGLSDVNEQQPAPAGIYAEMVGRDSRVVGAVRR